MVRARDRGIPVGSLADLVLHEAPCPVVGVTGTAGKTMTTRLIAHLAETVRKVYVVSYTEPRAS